MGRDDLLSSLLLGHEFLQYLRQTAAVACEHAARAHLQIISFLFASPARLVHRCCGEKPFLEQKSQRCVVKSVSYPLSHTSYIINILRDHLNPREGRAYSSVFV